MDCFEPYYPRELKEQNISSLRSHDRFSLHEIDIRNEPDLQKTFRECAPSHVIHLAARGGVRPSLEFPELYEILNIRGTLNVLKAAQITGGVQRFVFASSSSVYGVTDTVPFREDNTNLRVISPYGATKIAGEALCHTYHHLAGFSVACLRFFTVYGPRQRPDMAIRKFASLITDEREISLYGDGSSYRDYTYISDIIQGIVASVEGQFDFEIFNLGESKTIKLLDLIRLLEDALGKKARFKHIPMQPGDVPRTYACIDKARKMLGYNPTVTMEEGIKRFARWFLKQR